jgi:predicted dehydrogenase
MAGNGSVGWGVLGCGRVADHRFAPVFAKTADAELVAFCSRDLSKARSYARRHHARRAYRSLDELLADPEIHVVYIATPNALHAAQAIRCVRAGKHVLVDKPMATCIRDALQLVEAAGETGRIVGVLQQQRFHPANMHLIRLRDEGVLGKLNVLRVQIGMWYPPTQSWRGTPALSGGGAVMDLAPHALDLMTEIGGRIVRVDAQIRTLQFPGEVEDFACARLDLASGAIGLLELSYCQHQYGGRVEAYGSQATFAVEGSMQSAGTYYTWFRLGQTPEPVQEHVSTTDCYQAAIEDFTDAVQHGGRPSIDIMDGLRVSRSIAEIYTSARSGHPVDLPDTRQITQP